MSAYLSLRAIDEIEDHPDLEKLTKIALLRRLSAELQQPHIRVNACSEILLPHRSELPEVTCRLDEWLDMSPEGTVITVRQAVAAMSQRMAYWVGTDWLIRSKRDLDRYTFSVAGAVGVLLSDFWCWFDGTPSRRRDAISYGRGLQAVNILRNRAEDLSRGVDFFPQGWVENDFLHYARRSLLRGDLYVRGFPRCGPAYQFCSGPQALAHGTLEALERGEQKLSRNSVVRILNTKDPMAYRFRSCEDVVLVDYFNQPIGIEEKIAAHVKGALHRAFSVFVFNGLGELLLQRRTSTKYHSRGLWSNTCCGHPRPGEVIEEASRRRLREEMGFDSQLTSLFDFVYRAELEDGLIEHEYDHVLVGQFDGVPNPNPDEVAEWRWMGLSALRIDIDEHADQYTYWFRIALNRVHRALHPTSLPVTLESMNGFSKCLITKS
jgi:farnesyl-diphosphate farnesyltransferase